MRNVDRILANIRSDMLAMARDGAWNDNPQAEYNWRGALAANLKALGSLIEKGEAMPDPFPIFRHGEE